MILHEAELAAARDFILHPTHSTSAFREAPAPSFGAGMPIAYDEERYVGGALNAYRRNIGGFALKSLGYFNWPEGATEGDLRATRQVLLDFISYNDSVPFAFFEGPIPSELPFAIGRLRGINTEVLSGFVRPDALLTSHDADIEDFSFNHFGHAFDEYSQTTVAAVWPHLQHSPVLGMPRLNHLLKWIDDTNMRIAGNVFYDLGPVYSRPDYEAIGGYKPNSNMHETSDVVHRIMAARDCTFLSNPRLTLTVSPRRAVHLLPAVDDYADIWLKHAMSPDNSHRRLDPEEMFEGGDLTQEAHAKLLRAFGIDLFHKIVTALKRKEITDPYLEAERIAEAALGRLGGPEDMFDPPDVVAAKFMGTMSRRARRARTYQSAE